MRTGRVRVTHHSTASLQPRKPIREARECVCCLVEPNVRTFTDPTKDSPHVVYFMQDETVKATAYLYENLVDPETALSGDARKCAFSQVWSPGNSLWEFYDLPGNDFRRKRFGIAMVGFSQTDPAELNRLLEGMFVSIPVACPI